MSDRDVARLQAFAVGYRLDFFLAEGALSPWLLPPWTAEMGLAIVPPASIYMYFVHCDLFESSRGSGDGTCFWRFHDIIFYGLAPVRMRSAWELLRI